MDNFVIFLDIDGVIATRSALEEKWSEIVGRENGDEHPFEFWKKIEGYPRPMTSMNNWPFDKVAVRNYHKLQYHIYTKLNMIPVTVLSSSWRNMYRNISECKDEFALKGLHPLYFQGFTHGGKARGKIIKEYAEAFGFDKYITLDDDAYYDIIPHIPEERCVATTFETGFDDEKFVESLEKINKLLA